MADTSFRVVVLFSIAIVIMIPIVSANKCTDVLKKLHVEEVIVKVPCTEKYTARCGWLSLNYCTFYRSTYCDKKMNETITTYYIVTECCQGFFRAQNGTCLKKMPGVDYSYLKTTVRPKITTADPDYLELPQKRPVKKEEKSKISGGGYAGIACGFIFLICIVAFTINGIRKRRRSRHKDDKNDPAQQVLYMGQVARSSEPQVSFPSCMPPSTSMGSTPTSPGARLASQRSKSSSPVSRSKPSSPVSRETTPCDLSPPAETKVTTISGEPVTISVPNSAAVILEEEETGATPLLSGQTTPLEIKQETDADGGVTPLLSSRENGDDLPESDV